MAAFILDHGRFAGVPPTTFGHLVGDHVRLPSEAEVAPKRGSLQQYVEAVRPLACRGFWVFRFRPSVSCREGGKGDRRVV